MKSAKARLAHLASNGTPPDRETARHMSVGLEATLGRFDSEVFPYLASGGSEIQFVYGANGRGKTHYLLSVEDVARSRGFATAWIDCPIGASPFSSLRSTFEMIASSVRPPPVGEGDKSVGLPALIRSAFSPDQGRSAAEVISRLKSARHLYPEFRNLALAYGRGWEEDGLTDSVRDDLESLLLGSQTRSVTISSLYKSDKNLPRPMGRITERNAANWLHSLLSLPAVLGFPGVIILFDETERAFHNMSAAAVQLQLAHLRNIVDYCALGAFGGCLILYAAAEDFIDLAKSNLDALAQRIEPPALLEGRFPSSIRSVWTDLDDLTSPQTADVAFFSALSDRIITLGLESGLSSAAAGRLGKSLSKEAGKFAASPTSAIVREFVKFTANAVLSEVAHRG